MVCSVSLSWNTLQAVQAVSVHSEHLYLLLVHLKSNVQFIHPNKFIFF